MTPIATATALLALHCTVLQLARCIVVRCVQNRVFLCQHWSRNDDIISRQTQPIDRQHTVIALIPSGLITCAGINGEWVVILLISLKEITFVFRSVASEYF